MFTDAARWTPAVNEVCRREAIPFGQIETGYPGTNAVFIVGRAHVVKLYAPFCHADFFRERELYSLLGGSESIPVPRLIAHGVLADRIEWPYIVMEFKPGEPIREARYRVPSADLIEIASCLGGIVRQLHRIPIRAFRQLDRSTEGWCRFIETRMAECVEEVWREGVLPERVIREIPDFLERVDLRQRSEPIVLVNGDLTEDHLLVEQQAGSWRVSGLIDFGDAFIAQKEYDWVALWFGALDRDWGCLRAFMRSYDPAAVLDEAFVRTAMAFTFVHQFGALIISQTLTRMGRPRVRSMEELSEILWGAGQL